MNHLKFYSSHFLMAHFTRNSSTNHHIIQVLCRLYYTLAQQVCLSILVLCRRHRVHLLLLVIDSKMSIVFMNLFHDLDIILYRRELLLEEALLLLDRLDFEPVIQH